MEPCLLPCSLLAREVQPLWRCTFGEGRAFPFSSCSQGEALLARGERCRQRRVAALPAPLSSCPAPRWGRESRRQEGEERTTEKPSLLANPPGYRYRWGRSSVPFFRMLLWRPRRLLINGYRAWSADDSW